MSAPELDRFDPQGVLRETVAQLPESTRREFLGGGAAGLGGAMLGALAAAGGAEAAGPGGGDIAILNFALSLEYVQAAFYTEAERMGALTGVAGRAAAQIGAVERAHVRALIAAIGKGHVKRPSFDFGEVTSDGDAFLRTAVAFEDLAVAAYKGQLGRIASRAYLSAALSIHSVEARHAAWIRYLASQTPAADAVDKPITRREAERLVAATGFIVPAPVARRSRRPSFTG